MAVYVDDMRAPLGRLILCHMVADTHHELVEMAQKIGVDQKWIQHPGTLREHFDIALSKRALAVKAGAREITWRECGERERAKRNDPSVAERYFCAGAGDGSRPAPVDPGLPDLGGALSGAAGRAEG